MRIPRTSRAPGPWLAVLALICALPTAAAEPPARVSLLTPCGGAEPSTAEERLRDELALALDGFHVVAVDPGRADFADLPEAEQIQAAREATRNAADTSPVLWLECELSESPVARLLVIDAAGPTVRVITGGSLEELALIVREVVGADPPAPVGAQARPPADRAPDEQAEPPPPAAAEPTLVVGILSAVELGGGLVGHEGASFLGGAVFAVDLHLALGFFGRVALAGKIGPRAEEDEFFIVGQRIEPRIELGYLWKIRRLGLGPVVGLGPTLSFVDFAMENGHHQRQRWWSVRFAGGAEGRWRLTDRLSLVLDLTLGFMPNKRFYRRTTNETLLKTPTMDLAGALGVIVRI